MLSKPGLREQLTRTPRALPKLTISPALKTLDDVHGLLSQDTDAILEHFRLDGYDPHPALRFKVAV